MFCFTFLLFKYIYINLELRSWYIYNLINELLSLYPVSINILKKLFQWLHAVHPMVVPKSISHISQGWTCGSSYTPAYLGRPPSPQISSCLRLCSSRTVPFNLAIAAPGTEPCLLSVCKGGEKGKSGEQKLRAPMKGKL